MNEPTDRDVIRKYVSQAIQARDEQGLPRFVEDRATLSTIRDALEPRSTHDAA